MDIRLQRLLYRDLSRRLRSLQPVFGPGMQAVAWGMFGPLFHPSAFGTASVQGYLRQAFERPHHPSSKADLLQRALWVLRRANHVHDCLAAGICSPNASAKPLVDRYLQKVEPLYIHQHLRVASYPMLLDDLYMHSLDPRPLSDNSHCTTDGVEVTVRGSFLGQTEPAGNMEPRNCFCYNVRITNSSASVACLASHHLFFYNPRSKVMDNEIVAPGVNGLTPTLQPGQSHAFSASFASPATFLIMKGSFQFLRPTAGSPESFDVALAPLLLECRQCSTTPLGPHADVAAPELSASQRADEGSL